MANDMTAPDSLVASFQGMSRLPILRQIGLLAGLAGAIALAIAAVNWIQAPAYRPLFGALADKDQAAVMDQLAKEGATYRVDPGSGQVMVPGDKVAELKLRLASQGLPRGTQDASALAPGIMNSSPAAESARYQRILEQDLAQSVETIQHVQAARVHLAIPRVQVFARNREKPSASVLVNLFPGRSLEPGQVAAIVHLVASSIPNLEPARVTVVDQQGRLLSSEAATRDAELTSAQFDYTRRLEETYVRRIEEILLPITGAGAVRAQVAADMDFTVVESAQESYKPETALVRSEQTSEDRNVPGTGVGGIPGALSNTPPGAVSVPEQTPAKGAKPGAQTAASTGESPLNTSTRATRNFELDRTVSHTRGQVGTVKRLSVAVVLDHKLVPPTPEELEADEAAVAKRVALSEEEIARITSVVKEAVGFRADRGDTVQVVNSEFQQAAPEVLPEPSMLDQPWIMDAAKIAGGALVIALLIFGVLRPMLRNLSVAPPVMAQDMAFAGAGGAAAAGGPAGNPALAAPGAVAGMLPSGLRGDYEASLAAARQLATQDPRRVAQVVKNWVGNDG